VSLFSSVYAFSQLMTYEVADLITLRAHIHVTGVWRDLMLSHYYTRGHTWIYDGSFRPDWFQDAINAG